MKTLAALADLDRRLLELDLDGGLEPFRALLAARRSYVAQLAKQAVETPAPELSLALREAISTGDRLIERLARHRHHLNAGDYRLTHLRRMLPAMYGSGSSAL